MRRRAVIVDMDGTLCNVSSIRHHVATTGEKDFDAFHRASRHCPPNQQALDFCLRWWQLGRLPLVVTGRMETHLDTSSAWLQDEMLTPYDGPFMRPIGCFDTDVSVKRRIYRYLTRHYIIDAACDDNPSIIALWESLGIPVEVIPGWEQ